ncbi:MAG: 2-hydroxyacyl-CoA dehydratase [Hyphomonadaceae bacterium]|nr:2-hydroxyacyl-CoA dehydratase [Hyphomonadaceae bacterium]
MTGAFAAAFAPFERAWEAPWEAARAHKQGGGRVVGYMSSVAPRELIEAAGVFALRLDGVAVHQTPNADRIMERLFDPGVRGVCERVLDGTLDFLDAIVLPRTPDSVQRLYYYLCEAKRGGAKTPEMLFFDLLHTPWYSSAEYNFRRIGELRASLARIAGAEVGDDALEEAIARSNRRRAALRECLAARPERLSGGEALKLIAGAHRMGPDACETAATSLAAALKQQPTRRRTARLMLAGNAPDTAALHDLVEELGAAIVLDRHDMGDPSIGGEVDTAARPPLRALCDHYHRDVFSPRTFGARAGDVVASARSARADGVIFFFHAEEEVLTWDYPAQKDALEKAGVAQICLSGQPYQIDPASLRPKLQGFIEHLPATAGAH